MAFGTCMPELCAIVTKDDVNVAIEVESSITEVSVKGMNGFMKERGFEKIKVSNVHCGVLEERPGLIPGANDLASAIENDTLGPDLSSELCVLLASIVPLPELALVMIGNSR